VGATVLIVFGLMMALGFVVQLGEERAGGTELAAFLIAGVVPLLIGVALVGSHFRHRTARAREAAAEAQVAREREVVALAQRSGGRLSMTDVVSGTSLGITEAEALLEDLARNGYVDIQVTDDGVVEYAFFEAGPPSAPRSPG
jgi:hypothetical protein